MIQNLSIMTHIKPSDEVTKLIVYCVAKAADNQWLQCDLSSVNEMRVVQNVFRLCCSLKLSIPHPDEYSYIRKRLITVWSYVLTDGIMGEFVDYPDSWKSFEW